MTTTVAGGYWGGIAATYTPSSGENPLKRRIARLFNRASMRGLREIYLTIDGVAPGQLASETHKRIQARETSAGDLSGARTIETVTDVNRVTTAADVTDLATKILAYPLSPTYATNLDGNPRGVH